MSELPEPACEHGYPAWQVKEVLGVGGDLLQSDFWRWMDGQTYTYCGPTQYDHHLDEFVPDSCRSGPHGPVVYWWDLARYVQMRRQAAREASRLLEEEPDHPRVRAARERVRRMRAEREDDDE